MRSAYARLVGSRAPVTPRDSADDRHGVVRGAAHPVLRPFLNRRHVALDHDHDGSSAAWLEPPQATVTIMIGLGGSLRANGELMPDAWLGGPGGDCAAVEMSGRFSTIDVKLTPVGARVLLGLPLHELAGRITPLEDVLGQWARPVLAEIRDTPSWPRRLDLLDRFLLARLEDGPRASPIVVRAWSRLEATAGRVRIGALAREIGCSRRLLETAFRDEVGLPPKTVARLLRFEAVRRRIQRDPARWADIAHDHGYCDQAHLNRDFRELAGTTPSAFLEQIRAGPGAVLP